MAITIATKSTNLFEPLFVVRKPPNLSANLHLFQQAERGFPLASLQGSLYETNPNNALL